MVRVMHEPTLAELYDHARECVADLCLNGIDLCARDVAGLRALVREHRHYFDAMLGWELDDGTLTRLLHRACREQPTPECLIRSTAGSPVAVH